MCSSLVLHRKDGSVFGPHAAAQQRTWAPHLRGRANAALAQRGGGRVGLHWCERSKHYGYLQSKKTPSKSTFWPLGGISQLDLLCSFNLSTKCCPSILRHSSREVIISLWLWRIVKVRGEGNNQKVLQKQEALEVQVCWIKRSRQ